MSKTRRWDKYTTKSILLSLITLETGHPCVKLLTFQSQWSQLLWSLKVRFICLSVCLSVDLEAKIMVPGLLWPGLNSLTFRWPSTSVKQTIRINWLRFNIISGLICLLHRHSCSNNVVLNALATQMWSTECNLQVHELASKINTKQMSVKNNAKLRTVVEICIVTVNFFVISEY